jgi:hypothetical protein
MNPSKNADPCERDIRLALRHLKRAYLLVAGLQDYTGDDVGSVVVQEDIKAAFSAVKEYGYHQFNVAVGSKGRQ